MFLLALLWQGYLKFGLGSSELMRFKPYFIRVL
nr:MAG TPA: hypothetical protein [Bacteriophage sp.]